MDAYGSSERVLSVESIANLANDIGSFAKMDLINLLRGRATNPEKADQIGDAVGHFDRDDAVAAMAR